MDRFIILGSANAVPKPGQENTHLFAEGGNKRILVDCGDNALVSLRKNDIDPNTITDLVLTHFHADHVGSLPNLLMGLWLEKRSMALTIHGLEYTLDRAKALLGLFAWVNWANMFPVAFNLLHEDAQGLVVDGDGIKVTSRPVLHLLPTVGLKFEYPDGKTVAYTCDTEPCDNVLELAKGAQILIHEAAGPGKGHSSAEQAGRDASQAKTEKLVLIHYDQRAGAENLIRQARGTFAGEVVAATDGMVLF